MTELTDPMVAGVFRLSFATEATALAAAGEARTRGFVVEVTQDTSDRWQHRTRRRADMPVAELERYASRLRRIAVSFDGAYDSFTPD